MRSFLFFLFLLECAKASSMSLSELSSIIFLQCTMVSPEHKYLVLVENNGKVQVPMGLFNEHRPEGFICSKSAHIRMNMWNGGYFQEYLCAVKSPSSFVAFLDGFASSMSNCGIRKAYDIPTLLLLLKDGLMFALAIDKDKGEAGKMLFYKVLHEIISFVACLVKLSATKSGFLVPSFLTTKSLPKLPFNQPRSANMLSIQSAIRLVRLSERSQVREQYDTTELVHYIVRNYKTLHPLWMIKSRTATTSILNNEPWIKNYLSRSILPVDRVEYLRNLPLTMGVSLLHKYKTVQTSSYYNGLMYIDQIAFQIEYAWNGAGSTKDSIILEYLAKDPNGKDTYQYVEQYVRLWKELVTAGLASILNYQFDFLMIVTRINLARIHVILKNPKNEQKLALLDKVERFFFSESTVRGSNKLVL